MCGGRGEVEDGRIWLRVRRGCSQWKGLVGDGALRPVKTEFVNRKCNNSNIKCKWLVEQLPERKGLLCILLGGLRGIRVSKLTSEAPVGPRKASGVRHTWVGGALSGGASRDRSNISGLADSRPFTWGFTGGSVPNGSVLESSPENRSDSGFTPINSASAPGIKGVYLLIKERRFNT